jgi:hypothetical protein
MIVAIDEGHNDGLAARGCRLVAVHIVRHLAADKRLIDLDDAAALPQQ